MQPPFTPRAAVIKNGDKQDPESVQTVATKERVLTGQASTVQPNVKARGWQMTGSYRCLLTAWNENKLPNPIALGFQALARWPRQIRAASGLAGITQTAWDGRERISSCLHWGLTALDKRQSDDKQMHCVVLTTKIWSMNRVTKP